MTCPISARFWDGLPQEQRDAIQAAANQAIDQSTQRHLAQEQETQPSSARRAWRSTNPTSPPSAPRRSAATSPAVADLAGRILERIAAVR